ncbi:MAG TPA: phosphate-starvation-inducible PsiE family protein [Candidatus Manganitrophaceae bacterium]|nr:phosphate-starvation-inducible PsiE family protein [Candidatus Manganitrophaceae bacterium]
MNSLLKEKIGIGRLSQAFRRLGVVEASRFFVQAIRLLLCGLMGVILLCLTGGIVKTFIDLHLLFSEEVEVASRRILIDILILLAVVEIFKTTFTYFTEGRVKVTYIVDTVLVVMLSEVITLWFKGGEMLPYLALALLLSALGLIRVIAIRFSPTSPERIREH